jgi:DNA-binding NarL/FixJ family response regulator
MRDEGAPAGRNQGVVLIVDDAPANLAMLHAALDQAGYRVLVATDGEGALTSVQRLAPDIILLDAVMPGMDGFETCRRLKADPASAHIPVVFMTGLTDSLHVVQGFRAGGSDYVTKPIETTEVLARIVTHLLAARQTFQARQAVEATGHAMVSVDHEGRPSWQSPAAREWLRPCLGDDGRLPPNVLNWLRGRGEIAAEESLRFVVGGVLLGFTRLVADAASVTLLVRRHAGVPDAGALAAMFGLTSRESEVLCWVTCGKTNKDVGDILGMSVRTVDKHLQHVFAKLNVETRTAAASLVLGRGAARAA